MNRDSCAAALIVAFAMAASVFTGCSAEEKIAEPTPTLENPVTGRTSVVADVLSAWPAPSSIVQMAPPSFIYYGTQLLYSEFEIAPKVFRRVEFTFRGNSSADIYTLYRFRIYVENISTKPVHMSSSPLTLISGVEAGMPMDQINQVLGAPDEFNATQTEAHWKYFLDDMECHLSAAPDVDGIWRVFNLEFVFDWH